MATLEELLAQIDKGLQDAIEDLATSAAQEMLDIGTSPVVILEEGMAKAMFRLGERWKRGEVFLPEVVASAEVFKKCNAIVEPALIAMGLGGSNIKVVMLTVKGDLHDLGKNMVGAMLKTSGFEVFDIGKDTPTEKVIAAVQEHRPAIIGMSALLTTTVPQQQVVIKALKKMGLRDSVKVMVGGAPVTQEWADQIGADGYAPSAPEAVNKAKELTQQGKDDGTAANSTSLAAGGESTALVGASTDDIVAKITGG